ncbi:hypothetical protein [Flavobacterium microcysteis]|uniref:hypothetical protein n=1 Tax=Flavobacterium microcysteis TaxID=2596891 RepID=UPI001315097C|nr:hypothetical protein [Flavobacterium microcysteis]
MGFLFIILYLTDAISKIGDFYQSNISYTAIIIKIVLQIVLFLKINKERNFEAIRILKIVSFLSIVFLLGQFFSNSEVPFLNRVFSNLKILNWYLSIFILYAGAITFLSANSNRKDEIKSLFLAFEWIFYFNSLLMLIGFFFDIEIFKAYYYSNRFGFNGLIRNATHASYICIIYIIYFYISYKDKPSKTSGILLLISVFVSLLLGTKAVLLFLFLLSIYWLISLRKYLLIITFSSLLVIFILFFDKFMNGFIKEHSYVLYDVYKKDGIITMLFSYRNESILKEFYPYITQNWTTFNYIFGGAEFNLHRTEFEFLDLFWFFGIAGMMFYLYAFLKHILNFKIFLTHIPIILLFIIIFLAGSFFSSITTMTFFLALIVFLKKKSIISA